MPDDPIQSRAEPPLTERGDVPSTQARVNCVHAERCSGCPLIAQGYPEQLAFKQARVMQALAGYPGLEGVVVHPALPASPNVGYRTRAKLVVARAGDGPLSIRIGDTPTLAELRASLPPSSRSGPPASRRIAVFTEAVEPGDRKVAIGLYAHGGGHVVVDVPQCRVLTEVVAEAIEAVRAVASDDASVLSRISEWNGSPLLKAVDVREAADGSGEASALLTLVLNEDDVRVPERMEELRAAARELRRRCPRIAGVALSLRSADSPQILGLELTVLDGETHLPDTVDGVVHFATYGAFVQAHRGQAATLHQLIADWLCVLPGDSVLDLYGGSGAIGLALAKRGARVRMVESFAPAVRLATEAARQFGDDVSFQAVAAETSEFLAKMLQPSSKPPSSGSGSAPPPSSAQASGESRRFVVVNPPRRGLAPLVREQIARLGPQAIAYVSCDPETLARDLDHFSRLGYVSSALQPLDMIPLTEEVETLAVLRPARVPAPRVAYEDEDVVIVEKCAHEPTTPQGEYVGSLLQRVRDSLGLEDAVPVHRLDVGTSGLVIFARQPAAVQAWSNALQGATGRKVYIAAARGRTPMKGAITRELREDGRMMAARTRYRWLGSVGGHSVLRVIPEQGRTHQIRRHLASIGHPVLGDERYGHPPTNRFFEEKHALDRTFLHCIRLEIDHPRTGARLIVETPVPGDLRLSLQRCGGPSVLRFLEGKSALGGAGPSTLPPMSGRSSSIPPPPPTEGDPTEAFPEGEGRTLRPPSTSREDD